MANFRIGLLQMKVKTRSNHILQKCNFSASRKLENEKLPWIQIKQDIFQSDPLLHRIIGMFMFKRVLKYTKTKFDMKEFKRGVKDAIQVVADCIHTQDCDNRLQFLFGETLYHHIHSSFEELLAANENVHLNLTSIGNIRVTGSRFVFGEAEPGDEHFIDTLGQRIVLSKSEMEEFEDQFEGDGAVAGFKYGKFFSERAIQKRIRYQIDVAFRSEEILFFSKDNKNSSGDKDNEKHNAISAITCYHKWKFETPIYRSAEHSSPVDDDNETEQKLDTRNIYPLDWIIVDMNDYLKERYEPGDEVT